MFKKIIAIEALILLATTFVVSTLGMYLLDFMNVIVNFNLFEFIISGFLFFAFLDFVWYITEGRRFVALLHGNEEDKLFARSKLHNLKKDLKLGWFAFAIALVLGLFNPIVFIFALIALISIICVYSFIHLVNYYYFA